MKKQSPSLNKETKTDGYFSDKVDCVMAVIFMHSPYIGGEEKSCELQLIIITENFGYYLGDAFLT